ncbi:hypothetical protein BSLG_004330 [Batrachochytrium salamandrivorans]|nr:hypothetical protein BSLG_004330 [Batrachochytrium salamandrivorans]
MLQGEKVQRFFRGSLSDKNSKVQRPHLFSKNPASPKTQEDSVDPMTEPSNSIKFSKGSSLTNSSLDKSCKKAKDTLSVEDITYAEVSSVKQPDTESKLVEGNSLEIQSYLAKFFHKVIKASPDSLTKCVYLCINRICPEYKGKELGIGESLLLKSLANAAGRDVKTIKAEVDLVGDLGTVAQTKGSQKTLFTPKPLTVDSVFQSLVEICNISGQHIFGGKLRIGLAEQTVLSSLAHAAVLSDPGIAVRVLHLPWCPLKKTLALAEAVVVVKSVYRNSNETHACTSHKSLVEVLDRFEGMSFTCEYKYDGERAQIHRLEDGRVIIYSRNSENLSGKYPEVLERIPKVGASLHFAFDLLYLNGQSLITETLQRRRELLHNYFTEVDGQFQFAKHMTSDNVDEIQTFLDDSIVGNCEGLMVKTLEKEASYEPSQKDYVNGLGDSLDLVVIGGFIGRGKRTGWYGGYLLACYDEDHESYQTICKIGTGFSEEALAEQAEFFKSHIIDKPKPYYRDDKSPEQATSASQVAEMYTSQNINTGKALINEEGADDDFEY